MVSPNTLERVGIVVGSALLLGLPTGVLVSPFVSGITGWQAVLLWLVPGVVVGALVATGRLRVSYRQIWLFSLASWLVALLLWQWLDVDPVGGTAVTTATLGASVLALLVGALVAWANPTVQWRGSTS
jgi:hypothetical protein